ncbi:MAG: hypothetical protein DHS20C01_25510 [marine bacterium B5-7]|nr:MAG: hypothetical protein DHS20C01_25510 [marine bacterium B5-7]
MSGMAVSRVQQTHTNNCPRVALVLLPGRSVMPTPAVLPVYIHVRTNYLLHPGNHISKSLATAKY